MRFGEVFISSINCGNSMQRWCRRSQQRSNARHCNARRSVNSRPAILGPSVAGPHDRVAAGAAWGFRLGVLGVYISDEPLEELGAATGQNACGAIDIAVQAEDGCEEKVTLRCVPCSWPVHAREPHVEGGGFAIQTRRPACACSSLKTIPISIAS
jgi:hypothetical protein